MKIYGEFMMQKNVILTIYLYYFNTTQIQVANDGREQSPDRSSGLQCTTSTDHLDS